MMGNLFLLFAGALVLGLGRVPGALALPLLTKLAPGVVCLWFLVRRDWRRAGWAAGVTLTVGGISWLLAPSPWSGWFRLLTTSAGDRGSSVAMRLLLLVAVVLWAARRGHAWLLAPAMVHASPVLGGFGPMALLAAVPRLLRTGTDGQADGQEGGTSGSQPGRTETAPRSTSGSR